MKQLFKDTVTVSVDDIVPDPNNPNKMTKDQAKSLVYSMEKFDDVMPIVVDSKTMMVADGHHRLAAYKTMGVKEIDVIKKDFKNAAERILFSQTMNKLRGQHDKALDVDVVHALVNGSEENLLEYMRLVSIQDESAVLNYLKNQYPGFSLPNSIPEDEEQLAKLVQFVAHPTDDENPVITQKGDIWKLGENHYLLCDDCTITSNVNRLLDGKTVDLLLTDPPYGVNYSGKNEFLNAIDEGNRIEIPIENDDLKTKTGKDGLEIYVKLFTDFLKAIPFSEYNVFYIFMSSFALHALRQAIDSVQDLKWGDYLVWVKNNHVLGRKDYNSKHEFVVYGWKDKHKFYGPFSTTVLEFNKPTISDLHPVMKPVDLLEKLITDGSKKDMIVFDPFMGSGSTLIACEKTGRKCYGMEQDPRYCDVIVKRWEQYTGLKAEKLELTA